MLKLRRFGFFVVIGLAISMLVAGLPLSHLGLSVVSASYGYSTCGSGSSLYQIRLTGDTTYYADAALTQPIGVISAAGKGLQKFLVCDSSLNPGAKVYLIDIAGSDVYIFASAGSLAPRAAADGQ